MDERDTLLIPGPVTVEREVLEAFSRPIRPHYGADWAALYRRVAAGVAKLFRTEGDVLLLFGPGMAAVEMAVRSSLSPGDHVLIATNGMFGAGQKKTPANARVFSVRKGGGSGIGQDNRAARRAPIAFSPCERESNKCA